MIIISRKSKLSDELVKEAAECISIGMSYTATARALNISYETFANWRAWGSEGKAPYFAFYTAINNAESGLLKKCLFQLKKAADIGDINTIKWLLEKRYSEDFGKPAQLTVKSESVNTNLNVNTGTTADEADKIRRDILSRLSPKPLPGGF